MSHEGMLKPIEKILYLLKLVYFQLINFYPDNEIDESIKINKKMFLFLWYNMLAYCLAGTISSFRDPSANKTLFPVAFITQFLILRIKSYKTMVCCFILSALSMAYFSSFNENSALRLLGVALCQQNYSLLLPDSLMLRIAYILISLFVVQRPRATLFAIVEEGNIDQLEILIKNFCFAWPLLYLVNHAVSMYLVKSYQKTIKDYQEVQKQLAITNQQLQDANERLKETLSLLEKTNQDLEASLKARELFIASVSHELRNPLNVMIGNIELLGLDPLSPKQLQMLNTCKICGDVLLSLINNVLDVAKINAQKLELNYLPGDFYQLVEKIWNVSAMKMKQKDLNGSLYIERGFPKYIEMDSHRITQVLLNVLGNASKFTTSGFIKAYFTWHQNEKIEDLKRPHPEYLQLVSGFSKSSPLEEQFTEDNEMDRLDTIDYSNIQLPKTIKISQRFNSNQGLNKSYSQDESFRYFCLAIDENKLPGADGPLAKINSREQEGLMKISIIDTGCGISQAALEKIFLPFEQADSSITRRFGGTGLGLYITQQIVHKMGGEISVYSQEGLGTNFIVIIPTRIASERDTRKKTHEVKAMNSKRELKALVVDDSYQNQLIICSFLTKLNIQSEIANNGKEAYDMFVKNGHGYYSVITMDIQMPIMDGLAACRKIRRFEREMGVEYLTPIIVVTGNCTDHEKNECLNPMGDIKANYFFRKPFTYDECKNSVQNIIMSQGKVKIKKNNRVLIVDDDPFNQKIIQEYLSKYGFSCDTCSNGEKALQKLRQYPNPFEVVLMDCEMPGIDGYTAAKYIKRSYPHMLIIGITGHTEAQYIQKALESGMKHVETKPVDFKRLVSLISIPCSP